MEYVVLGWPADGPTLRLDYRRFSYAGKFVMSNSGKVVVLDEPDGSQTLGDEAERRSDPKAGSTTFEDDVVAAISFNEDRTESDAAWLRYITVRADRRGEGIGPRLAAFATARLHERGYDRVRIAVNNPFAYQALHRAGFAFTGERTGIAELVLAHPSDGETRAVRYQDGLDAFREREGLADAERSFLREKRDAGPPSPVRAPEGSESGSDT